MNRKLARRNRKKSSKRSKPNSFRDWFQSVDDRYGIFRLSPENKEDSRNQGIIVYNSPIPQRMPDPQGPIGKACLSMTQYVGGDNMTLATGSAVVGSLLRQSSNADVFAGYSFALADISNISAISTLFDKYRIDRVHFRLRSRNPALFMMNQTSPNYSATAPLLIVDRDDGAAPTTLSSLKQYANTQVFSACDSIDVVFEPSITPAVYSGGVFSGYAVQTDPEGWLDMVNTTIPHYGIKVGIPALVTSTTSRLDWDVEAWYTVSFKDPI